MASERSQWSLVQLVNRSKLRSHTEGGAQFPAGRNCLDSLLLLERALLVSIGQAPARLDTQKRTAVRPQRHIRNTGQIHHHPPSARRIDIGELRARNINQFEKDGTRDRKSTRLNSSHRCSSYAVFCLKKKRKPRR